MGSLLQPHALVSLLQHPTLASALNLLPLSCCYYFRKSDKKGKPGGESFHAGVREGLRGAQVQLSFEESVTEGREAAFHWRRCVQKDLAS